MRGMSGWKALGFESYYEYLRHPIWLEKQQQIIKLFPICYKCKCVRATQVHHLNYCHIGNEKLWDLISVCSACHIKIHKEEKRGDDRI